MLPAPLLAKGGGGFKNGTPGEMVQGLPDCSAMLPLTLPRPRGAPSGGQARSAALQAPLHVLLPEKFGYERCSVLHPVGIDGKLRAKTGDYLRRRCFPGVLDCADGREQSGCDGIGQKGVST